ncbi:hypothetical protein H4W80_001068 [Nonomuraea angiospora]|uniref:ABC transporter permease n=1 Tax=Nonomuraea angiospora TaxID=46172 RepID=A0ABR9LQY4_9ACTN|nr:hypothetical protein [Nonomuraea angiospora]
MTIYRDPDLLAPATGFWIFVLSVAVILAAAFLNFHKRDI